MDATAVWLIKLFLPLIWGEIQFRTKAEDFRSDLSSAWVERSRVDHSLKLPRAAGRPTNMKRSDKLETAWLHNKYRSKVVPEAADMEYMEWDDRIASVSQEWAEQCIWKHNKNTATHDFPHGLGENLYRGWNSSIAYATDLWFNEYVDYDIDSNTCRQGKQCGHYTQMVWSKSRLVGCGIKEGCWGDYRYYIVCNYSPPGNYRGQKPYEIGAPCSRCSSGSSLCSDKTCMKKSQCEKHNIKCGCDLKCLNCGELDPEECTCNCTDGWRGNDCSVPCADAKEDCSVNNCRAYELWSASKHPCEKTCKVCKSADSDDIRKTCCDGVTCPAGEVLDLSSRPCECKPLCPGPKCGSLIHQPHLLLVVIATLLLGFAAL